MNERRYIKHLAHKRYLINDTRIGQKNSPKQTKKNLSKTKPQNKKHYSYSHPKAYPLIAVVLNLGDFASQEIFDSVWRHF